VKGVGAGQCSVEDTCSTSSSSSSSSSSSNGQDPLHSRWQSSSSPHNSSLPNTAITTVGLSVQFTSDDLTSRINETHVHQAVLKYVTTTTTATTGNDESGSNSLSPSDYELRVVDANYTVLLPSLLVPWAPPSLDRGHCANTISFNAYFVSDNATTILSIKELVEEALAGE